MQLHFKCRVCGSTKLIKPDSRYQCFQDYTYCQAEWMDMTHPLPELETNIFWRSDEIPQIGEKRFLKIRHPFCGETGKNFRTLFQPALSSVNGIGEPPEELEQSAVVTCQLDEILEKNDFCAWVSVTVREVLLLSELYRHYPEQASPDLFEKFQERGSAVQTYPFSWQNWDYDSWTMQGDVGEWKLFFTDPNGKKHLILLYYWGSCDEILYIGNIIKS